MAKETGFQLDKRLDSDCTWVMDLPLSRLLLMNDANYPWCILVPRRPDITEIYQLQEHDYSQLQQESRMLGEALMRGFQGDKLNIGALGNVVAQLHVHHIVRYKDDAAWPQPVWGKHPATPYQGDALQSRLQQIRALMQK